MKVISFEAVVRALNEAGVHYLVVGGLAVVSHGYLRVTLDIDLVVKLTPPDILAAFRALATLGYRPAVPVTAEQFADPAHRDELRAQKNMIVLKLWSDDHPETPIDIFLSEPFDFDAEYARAYRPGDPAAPFASIPALIAMKLTAGRDIDRIDIAKLRQIAELEDHD